MVLFFFPLGLTRVGGVRAAGCILTLSCILSFFFYFLPPFTLPRFSPDHEHIQLTTNFPMHSLALFLLSPSLLSNFPGNEHTLPLLSIFQSPQFLPSFRYPPFFYLSLPLPPGDFFCKPHLPKSLHQISPFHSFTNLYGRSANRGGGLISHLSFLSPTIFFPMNSTTYLLNHLSHDKLTIHYSIAETFCSLFIPFLLF